MLLSTPKTIRKECHISFRPHSLMNLKKKKTDFVYRYCQFYDLLSLLLDTQRNCWITLRNGLSLLTTLRLILTLSRITQGNCLILLLASMKARHTYEWFIHCFTTYFLSQEGLHFHNLNIHAYASLVLKMISAHSFINENSIQIRWISYMDPPSPFSHAVR